MIEPPLTIPDGRQGAGVAMLLETPSFPAAPVQ